jgi:hypothetical protein
MIKSPFKFLDSYTREDRKIFFGRDREITELYRRIFESKILLVYGISGTGKSSLINCGLASRFDDSDWLPINVRRGTNIVESLSEAFSRHSISTLKENLPVSEKLQSIYLDHFKPIYLIFDQFEELFIFGNEEEKKSFIKLVKEIVDSETQCKVIFVIREEFLAGITEFEYDLPEIFSNRFRVEKMKRANAILAIEGPCKAHNIETETGFSEELIDKLCPAGNEIELTYLQIYLDRIYRIALNEKEGAETLKFSKELLNKAGNVSDLLGQFLEEQIREMDDQVTGMAILKSFVSVQGTKKQMTEPEILNSVGAFGTVISHEDLLKYLEKYVELRILRERDETGHFELRHDALAAKIYESFTLSEKELLEVRLFVENAYQAFNTRKTYLNSEDLQYLETYEKRLFLPPALTQFVRDSKEKLHSQQKALRRLTSLVAVFFLIIVGVVVQYYLNKKGFAETKELITLALLQEKVDPLTSLKTAYKVREKDSISTVIQSVILTSFNSLLQKKLAEGDPAIPKDLIPRKIPVNGSIVAMKLNRTGTSLYGWTDDKEVFISGVRDTGVIQFKVNNEIEIIEMSDNARYLAVIYKNSEGEVYSGNGKKLFPFKTTVNHLMNKRLVRFFPSGKYFMAAVYKNKAVIYDSTGVAQYDLSGHTASVNSLDISPDGRFIVTASSDNTGLVWNYNRDSRLFSPYDTLISHKDTVWSCEFNKTGKYILTASADSMLYIWNLNGERKFIYFFFFSNSIYGNCTWTPGYERRLRNPERHFAWMSEYYQKVCDAKFATGQGTIVATNYFYKKREEGNGDSLIRSQVIYWDPQSFDSQAKSNDYSLMAQKQSDSLRFSSDKLWKITSDNGLFASVTSQGEGIMLISSGGFQMMNIKGTFPEFSGNGKFLYYINNRKIYKMPVSLAEIKEMVFKQKIFGNPGNGENIWKIL